MYAGAYGKSAHTNFHQAYRQDILGVQKSSELFFVKFNLLNLSHRI